MWLLWLVPALGAWAAAAWWGERRRTALSRALGDDATLARLAPSETTPRRRRQAALEGAALAFAFVALAGPQWGVERVETLSQARQVMIAVDVSQSMAAEDMQPSRLEKAKGELAALLDELRGQRVGVIAFAGEAVTVCPLTNDVDAAKQLLKTLSPGMVPSPGSAIGAAIREAAASLEKAPAPRSIVLITDGEDHRTDPEGAAKEAAALGIRIYGIGVGTPDGGPIPLRGPGGELLGYKKDKKGNTVVSRLGEKTLQAAAAATDGAYLRAGSAGGAAEKAAEWILGTGGANEAARGEAQRYRNRFRLPLALAFALLLAALATPERGRLLALPALLAALAAAPAPASASAEGALRRGNKLYLKGDPEAALAPYAEAGRKSPKDPRPLFNAGAALYRLERSEQAAQAFEASAALSARHPRARAAAHYNEGGAHAQAGDYQKAVAAFRKAVALDPSDEDARHNLAVALRRLKNPPPPKPKDPKGKSQNQPEKPRSQGQSRGGAGSPKPAPSQREKLSREDAERILRAALERERAAQNQAALPRSQGRQKRRDKTEEDW